MNYIFLLKLRHSAANNVTVKHTLEKNLGYFFAWKQHNGQNVAIVLRFLMAPQRNEQRTA